MSLTAKTTRIAITGISGGGKTVFLAALLQHLCEYDSKRFNAFGPDVDIHGFQEMKTRQWPPFEFDGYRKSLAKGEWPEKTSDCAQFICEFDRTDWRFFRQRLEFFDFPGERIADVGMAEYAEYDDWSDHILSHFRNHHDYAEAAGPFLDYLDAGTVSETELIHRYRLTLACLILDCKPLISPSTFLLDQYGKRAEPGTPEEIASQGCSGLAPTQQFAPLSKRARESNPELAKKMKAVFSTYRKEIAMPVFREVSSAERLVVLVDIPSLLAGGVGRYNDNRQILTDLFDALRPDSGVGRLLRSLSKVVGWSLDRVALVAAKADMVHPQDIENGRLEELLRQMTNRVRRMLPDVKFEWFPCSACRSTLPSKSGRKLVGRPAKGNPEKRLKEYSVPELPKSWPDKWAPEDYPFVRVYPNAAQNLQKPPFHINLDSVFRFLTE